MNNDLPETQSNPPLSSDENSGEQTLPKSVDGDDFPKADSSSELLVCKVIAMAPGGCVVDVRGFLPTEERLEPGEEIVAQFASIRNGKLWLSAGGGAMGQGYLVGIKGPDAAARVLYSNDNAFEQCSTGSPPYFKIRRATDLMMTGTEPDIIEMNGPADFHQFILSLEQNKRTGCCKFSCDKTKSRGAILVQSGRCVGAIFSNEASKPPLPTRQALSLLLADCQSEGTQAIMCDWPDDVVLSMASLFLGVPLELNEVADARSGMDSAMEWLGQEKGTGCLTFTLGMTGAILFAFIYDGEFVGSFFVEIQQFSRNKSFVYNLITQDPNTTIAASMLPSGVSVERALGFDFSECLRELNHVGTADSL